MMRLNTVSYFKYIIPLLVSLLVLSVSGCFDSNTEDAPPSVNNPTDNKPGDDGPVANDDTLSVPINTSGVVSVLDNDSAASGALIISSVDPDSVNGGSILDNGDGTFTYTPPGNYEGEDTFTYLITDDTNQTSSATVLVTVSSQVIPNGRVFYTANCAICHAAGSEDTTVAFNASDLALNANPLLRDMSVYGGTYKLMGSFYNVAQKNVDELKAYLATL